MNAKFQKKFPDFKIKYRENTNKKIENGLNVVQFITVVRVTSVF